MTAPVDKTIIRNFPTFGEITANLTVRLSGQTFYLFFNSGLAGLDTRPISTFTFNADGEETPIYNIEADSYLSVQSPFITFTPNLNARFFVDFACIENSFRISTLDREYLLAQPLKDVLLFTTTPEIRKATIFTAVNIVPTNTN